MNKIFSLVATVVLCLSGFAFDLPVPEQLVGKQTVAIIHINVEAIKFDVLNKTVTDKAGADAAKGLEQFKEVLEMYKGAGGADISIVVNADKKMDPANAGEGVVICVNKGEKADDAKLTALFEGLKEKMAPGCPKKIGDSLVWHSAKYKLAKADEEKEKQFSDAYSHLAKDTTISVVFIPDDDAVELAEAQLKDSKKEDAEMMKALLTADAFCLTTDIGGAAAPSLKLLVVCADADEAKVVDKAANGLLAEVKKEAPPPAKALLDTLKLVTAGANVQLSIDLDEIAKAAKSLMEAAK